MARGKRTGHPASTVWFWRYVLDWRDREIDPATVISTFHMDQWGKICRHHWKVRLKISKIAKFENDTS